LLSTKQQKLIYGGSKYRNSSHPRQKKCKRRHEQLGLFLDGDIQSVKTQVFSQNDYYKSMLPQFHTLDVNLN
jgi:hypothetical protein